MATKKPPRWELFGVSKEAYDDFKLALLLARASPEVPEPIFLGNTEYKLACSGGAVQLCYRLTGKCLETKAAHKELRDRHKRMWLGPDSKECNISSCPVCYKQVGRFV